MQNKPNPSPASITVTIPARLHLGFLDLNGRLGRRYGGIGLAVSHFRTRVSIRRAAANQVVGPEHDRVCRYVKKMNERLKLDDNYLVSVIDAPPVHAGFGSGTQLAMAIAAGIRCLHGLPLAIEGDAIQLGRGARSGIGIGLFHLGGLVVDGGIKNSEKPAPIVSHMNFPDAWRIIVVLDPARKGMHGAIEASTFDTLPLFSDVDAAQLCRLILMQALPALADRDIACFGSAIKELQARLGDYFSAVQGGSRFTSPDVAAVLTSLDHEGAFGIGQSSWGPTGFAFSSTALEADRLARIAQQHPRGQHLVIRVCEGFNHAAEITADLPDAFMARRQLEGGFRG